MRIYNFTNRNMTEEEVSTLKTAFTLVDKEGLEMIGFALIAPDTVVLIDTREDQTADAMRDSAIDVMEDNLDQMPDFSMYVVDHARVAAVTMNDGMLMAFIPYEDSMAKDGIPLATMLTRRGEVLDACEKEEVIAVAWDDVNQNVQIEGAEHI